MIAWSWVRECRAMERAGRRANLVSLLAFVGLLGAVILERIA